LNAVERPPLADPASHLRLWSTAVIGLTLDLWSKSWAFQTLGQGEHRTVIPGLLEMQTMLNDGALFGIGAGRTTFFIIASLLALALVLWMFAQNPPKRWLLQIALGGILAGALGNMYDRVTVRLVGAFVPTQQGRAFRYFEPVEDDGHTITLREYAPRRHDALVHQLSGTAREQAEAPAGHVRDFIKINTTAPNWSWLPKAIRGKELWPWVFNVADTLLVGGVLILAIHLWTDRKRPTPETAEPAVDAVSG
jgi:signal peptidase II